MDMRKNVKGEKIRKLGKLVVILLACFCMMSMSVQATSGNINNATMAISVANAISQMVGKIDNIGTLFTSIISSVGAIVLIVGIFDLGMSFAHHDPTQIPLALKRIVSGLIMASVNVVVAILK